MPGPVDNNTQPNQDQLTVNDLAVPVDVTVSAHDAGVARLPQTITAIRDVFISDDESMNPTATQLESVPKWQCRRYLTSEGGNQEPGSFSIGLRAVGQNTVFRAEEGAKYATYQLSRSGIWYAQKENGSPHYNFIRGVADGEGNVNRLVMEHTINTSAVESGNNGDKWPIEATHTDLQRVVGYSICFPADQVVVAEDGDSDAAAAE